jgi:RNA polymerase sigma factor (TIGR02999 family)
MVELMPADTPEQVTEWLRAWGDGDEEAFQQLVPIVYGELRRRAHRYMARERGNHTLDTGALVNEAYLKLVDQRRTRWQNRMQFFGIAAQLMRRILVDHARSRQQKKRGGGEAPISIDEVAILSPERGDAVIALDEALDRFAAIEPRKARIIELHYFGGLTAEDIAQLLGISAVTVMRDWRFATAWLRRDLTHGPG